MLSWLPTGELLLADDATHPDRRGAWDEMTLVPIVADNPQEIFRIGREMFPGRRLAAVNHEDDED